ncbi:MAG: branched-chain amino acid aminotransferase [Spirochaetes bacterium]|nr:MAG: branched-chain amino acid aminotransferase [Spirochaetota bacterium]
MAIYSEETADYIWRNGKIIPWKDATIHVNAVGHASVAGIFEGIKAYWNEDESQLYIFRLEEHIERFIQSIKMVRYGFGYTKEQIKSAIVELLRANRYRRNVYIRPYIFQKGIVRELLQAQPDKPTEVVIDSWPFDSYRDPDKGLHVCVSSWRRISDNIMPPRLKCFSNYHNGRLAAMEAAVSGYDWPVLLDDRGKVTEGPGACLAIVRDGKVITPEITNGILESITRDTIKHIFEELLKIPFVERTIDRTELYIADEIFFLGTGWEIMPVLSVDRLSVGDGKTGSISKKITGAYREVVTGKSKNWPEWRTAVWD